MSSSPAVVSQFGGPNQVDNQLAEDDQTVSRIVERRVFEPWFAWKNGLADKYGLSFGIDYSMVWLGASDSPVDA